MKKDVDMETKHPREAGFTLLELLVVLAILGLLAAIVGPQVIRYLDSSKSQSARVQAKNIVAALNLFKLDASRYPTQEEGVQALVKAPANMPNWNGPYLPQDSAIVDPWGRTYLMKVPGEHGEVDVYSLGSDGQPGGTGEARDVGSW
ncbi:type II secretion system major pseudopilin GspG [Sphingomonas sp. QA11]|uniref:type II secretion system major pseudopilin GspG n=1 Tax=Sphingomonas sp. QA11 TaxID=2950605 RepID=UPI00234A0804|nr:type II secretion system major pseudopilin GspG [Sphingomonas sp. QA11]WCM28030.1 type II secretion system major pseudopilin GspG [Sphingomonas sp. QA11]